MHCSHRTLILLAALPLAGTSLSAQTAPASAEPLAPVTVYSSRVANQEPAGTFAMPVSALRYEPLVDVQARNLAEGQADVSIRGGIFENTGFRVGGVSLFDPQTGHYLAEVPVAPAMLGAPQILTGLANATGTTNATTGSVAYGWRPIQTAGFASVAAGQYATHREELYQGYRSATPVFGGVSIGADVAVAHSESDGSIAYGDSKFNRINGRVQFIGATSQTDVFAGYQAKFFGWPNLYTPFNSNESENLETTLLSLNHRANLGGGDWVQFAAYHRRNKDDYAFNRLAPLGAVHPFQHTTWTSGAALDGRNTVADFSVAWRAEVLSDFLKSTSLTAGNFHDRTLTKLAFVPEKTWDHSTLRAGATYDHSDRDGSSVSPVVEFVQQDGSRRWHVGYSRTTQVPTYTALNSSATAGLFRGNANLSREASHQIEAGVSDTFAGWAVEAGLFWRRDDSLVDWTFRRGVTARTANAVDIDTGGVELVARRSWSAIDLVLGYTGLTKDADYRSATVDASFYALNYAKHRFTAAATARLSDGFELRLDNEARVQADNLLRTVGGRTAYLTSAALAWHPPGTRGLEFSVTVENLWNDEYQEVPAVPAAKRQLMFGASYAW